jgi:hypothetical protein
MLIDMFLYIYRNKEKAESERFLVIQACGNIDKRISPCFRERVIRSTEFNTVLEFIKPTQK